VDPTSLLDIATDAAHQAGALLLQRFALPATGVSSKSTPTDPVSDADRDAEALVATLIRSRRPADRIVTEEGSGSESGGGAAGGGAAGGGWDPDGGGLTWIVDPLDGTVNFLFGIPVWSVSIAVEDRDGAVAGVVFDPNRHESFTATRNGGAHLNGASIQVSARSDLESALIGTGFAYEAKARSIQAAVVSRVLPLVRDVRRAGSAALDLASVACGRLDAFYEAPMEWWDKAAGVLLVREAGGIVTDLPAPLGLSPGVIAGGPVLHRALTSLVAS
jgi:myo-inositol-1(or 4)-monophosphatase